MWCRERGALRSPTTATICRAAVVADVSFGADLALVRVDGSLSTPVIRLAAHNPLSGDKVTLVGFPQGGPVRVVDGRVVDYLNGAKTNEPGKVMRSSTEAEPGNSGGPLVTSNRRAGGIVFAIDLVDNYALIIPASTIRATLHTLDPQARRAWATCRTDP